VSLLCLLDIFGALVAKGKAAINTMSGLDSNPTSISLDVKDQSRKRVKTEVYASIDASGTNQVNPVPVYKLSVYILAATA
jgi:uncharacterized protein (UPF0297 family)